MANQNDDRQKVGFVKTPRAVEIELFGPNSKLPEKWRVFFFIKYRIQDNKRASQSERISREYIIEQTGIWPNHFSRIIKSLEEDWLIQVQRGNSRDSVATYSLHKERFTMDVIVPDLEKPKAKPNTKMVSDVDNFEAPVDKSPPQTEVNTKMVSENQVQHQNGVTENQNGVSTPLKPAPVLAVFSPRSLLTRSLELRTKALEGVASRQNEESFTHFGSGNTMQESRPEKATQLKWLKETHGAIPFEQWEQQRAVAV